MANPRGLADIEPRDLGEIIDQIRLLATQGESDQAISVRLNVKASVVSVLRRRAGIPPGKIRRVGVRQTCVVPTGLNRELARLLEAAGLGRVRRAGVGVILRLEGFSQRVDRPVRMLASAGWVTVGGDGVYRPTESGGAALKEFQARQAERHGLVVSRRAPRAGQDGG